MTKEDKISALFGELLDLLGKTEAFDNAYAEAYFNALEKLKGWLVSKGIKTVEQLSKAASKESSEFSLSKRCDRLLGYFIEELKKQVELAKKSNKTE